VAQELQAYSASDIMMGCDGWRCWFQIQQIKHVITPTALMP